MVDRVNEEIILTKEGYDKIVAEHDELVAVKRSEVAERIKDYEYGISRWFDAAEELYPNYYEMSLSQQHVLKASIDSYVGYSI